MDLGGIRDQLDDTSKQLQQDTTSILLLNMHMLYIYITDGYVLCISAQAQLSSNT